MGRAASKATVEAGRYRADGDFSAHDGATLCLCRVPHPRHGDCLVSAGADGVIRFYTDQETPVLELREHDGWIWALGAAPDALFSGGEDGTVRRHELGTAACATSVQLGLPVHSLLFTGEKLLVGLADGRLLALDPKTLATRREHRPHQGALRCMLALRDGRIATGSEDDTVALWSSDLATELHRATHGDFVRALVELPDGALLSGSYDGTLRCFSPPTACAP